MIRSPVTPPLRLCLIAFLIFLFSSGALPLAHAQVELPDRRHLFSEDKAQTGEQKQERKRLRAKQKSAEKQRRAKNRPFDIHATNIRYDSSGKVIEGEGGLVLSYAAAILEAERGKINVESKEAELSGEVRITDPSGTLAADRATLQLDAGTGQLEHAELFLEEGDYQLVGGKIEKLPGETYQLEDAHLTTCACPQAEKCTPWLLDASSAKVTREGYGQVWNAVLRAYDVPVFYFPYLFFPAKNQRQSGFLPADIGQGKRGGERGFHLHLPYFWAIDRSTDATFTGIVETESRYGMDTEFRKYFSAHHKLTSGLIYLNETPREGDLQGTVVDGLNDPTLKENRFGSYLRYNLRESGGPVPVQIVLDGRYANDDLFIREYENDNIARYNARFVTSRGVVRTSLLETFSLEAAAEYNQAMVDDDDRVFQHLPELTLTGLHTFRPFGSNPLGLKLVLSDEAQLTNFSRKESFDGTRSQLRESLRLPFHLRNYFEGAVASGVRLTRYDLGETDVLGQDDRLTDTFEESSTRVLPDFSGQLGTIFERVYDTGDDSFLKTIAELGKSGRHEELVRLKHTIEPTLRYRFLPFVDQRDNPQFDSEDRLPRKNVVSYQLTQRLINRFEPREQYLFGVEESVPRIEDLGNLKSTSPVDEAFDYGTNDSIAPDFQDLQRGSKREAVTLKLGQSFDLDEFRKNRDEDQRAYSDLGADLKLFANEYLRFEGRSTYDPKDADFTSYSFGTQLLDKRGDQLRARLTFIDDQQRQLETGVEAKILDRLKVGYYARYDDRESEFIEQRAGARMYSSCNCWIFNVELHDRINPDETVLDLSLTLVGLGEIGNSIFTDFFKREPTKERGG